MYTTTNFKTKKAMREAFKSGTPVEVLQEGGFFPGKTDGRVSIEGPHLPAPHTWYASVEIADSVIVKVIS